MKSIRTVLAALLMAVLVFLSTACSTAVLPPDQGDVGESTPDGFATAPGIEENTTKAPNENVTEAPDENITETPDETTTETQPQYPDEMFSGDAVIGSEYFEGTNIAGVNSEVNLFYPKDDGSFMIHSVSIGGVGMTNIIEKTGTYSYDPKTEIYTLVTNKDGTLYGKHDGRSLIFCNADGSEIFYINNRSGNGITETEIEVRPGNSDYGYKDLAKNRDGAAMQAFYRQLLELYENFYDSTEDITPIDGQYIFATVDYGSLGLTDMQAISVWKIFGLENPGYYYFRNATSLGGGQMTLYIDEDYATAANRARYHADVEAMVNACRALLTDGMSELERTMIIHDFVVQRINYAYESNGKTPENAAWAHNIIGVASKGWGVCESYAKTLDFLCSMFGLDVLTVTGFAGEPHAWNVVDIDGKWYCIDATWNDTGDNDSLSYDCFGLSYNNMIVAHRYDTPEEFGVAYLYDIPAVSYTDIQLVTLYEDGENLGFRKDIDDALADMNDPDAEYTVELFNYSYSGPKLLSVPLIKHFIFADETPNVQKISLTGTYRQSEGGFISMTPIYLMKTCPFLITSDFSIENMEILEGDFMMGYGIRIEDATLTFTGSCCESEVSSIQRTEKDTSSAIEMNTNSELSIYSDLDVHRIFAGSLYDEDMQSVVVLRGDTKVDVVEVSVLRLTYYLDRQKVEIGRFQGVGRSASINLENVDLVIRDIYFDEGTEFYLDMRFCQLEQVSHAEITGSVSDKITVHLNGEIIHVSTDLEGNVINEWVEKVDPFDLNTPFLRIHDPAVFDNVQIDYLIWVDGGGYGADRTALYELAENGDVIRTENVIMTDDGFLIKNGYLLIAYSGDAVIPVIPAGITHIAQNAFLGRTAMESVVVPEGVVSIDSWAFDQCEAMRSLSLPASLEWINTNILRFGDGQGECSITYAGTIMDWLRLMSKSDQETREFSSPFIACSDGDFYNHHLLYAPFPDQFVSSQDFTVKHNETDYQLLIVFRHNEYEKGFVYYYVGETNSSTLCTEVDSFSSENGLYTVVMGEDTYYLKTDGGEFTFCDADGNMVETYPPLNPSHW